LLRAVDIGTSHIAGYSYDGKTNAVAMVYQALCAHFGVPASWRVDPEHLPKSHHHTIPVPGDLAPMDALKVVVPHSYDILDDDRLLRALYAGQTPDGRPSFQRLRTGYRVRREFCASTVEGGSAEARALLGSLGYKLSS
jgi:erythronate-4-phosphate dehydrogenase